MRFTRLTNGQLEELREDFIAYLVINGIPADEWESLKVKQDALVEHHIIAFSEMVWIKILNNHRYLHFEDNGVCYDLDFSPVKLTILNYPSLDNNAEKLTIGIKQVDYTKSREDDMFVYLCSGAQFENGDRFRALISMIN